MQQLNALNSALRDIGSLWLPAPKRSHHSQSLPSWRSRHPEQSAASDAKHRADAPDTVKSIRQKHMEKRLSLGMTVRQARYEADWSEFYDAWNAIKDNRPDADPEPDPGTLLDGPGEFEGFNMDDGEGNIGSNKHQVLAPLFTEDGYSRRER